MRNQKGIRKALTRVAAVALTSLTVLIPVIGLAQTFVSYPSSPTYSGFKTVAQGYGSVTTNVGGLIMYTGPQPCGTVAISAAGDMTLLSGVCGSEVADTTVECPVSGPLGGILDMSTPAASCDTVGEIEDLLNASGSWKFVRLNMLRSDSTDNTFNTLSAVNATTAKGIQLFTDPTVALNMTVSPGSPDDDIRFYFNRNSTNASTLSSGPNGNFVNNPWKNRIFRPLEVVDKVTTTGAATFTLYCSKDIYATNQAGQPTASQTLRTIWSEAGGATTVQHTKAFPFFECEEGEHPIFRLAATTTLSVGTLYASAISRDGTNK